MSILRRLLLSITIAIAIILLGTLVLSISAARDYLSGQLQTQSKDAAVSLALSLSQPGNDEPTIQTLLVSALFDGGHFAEVSLDDPQGRPIVQRRIEGAAPPVPRWFRALVPLRAKSASHTVTDGWRQIGTVTLVANDVYAWETLWQSTLRMVALVLGAGVLWALFAFALVRWIKRGLLSEVGEQVRALGQGRLRDGPIVARVPELAAVADAMNQAREMLRITAEEQSAKVESLRVELNQDATTGAANRKYFINEFRRALESGGGAAAAAGRALYPMGHVMVFRLRDLAEINRHMHRALVDQWLKMVYARMQEMVGARQQPGALLARLNGSDFALLFPHSTTPVATLLAERLRTELRHLRIPVGEGGLCRWVMALTDYAPGTQAGEVLARLDHALMQAESAGDDRVQFSPAEGPQARAMGESAWRETLMSGIEHNRYALAVEPLRDGQGNVVRHEASLTLLDAATQDPMPASLFIPAAVRLNLSAECDLQAVRLGLQWLQSHSGDLTVRLALPSLKQSGFLLQLQSALGEAPALAQRLVIEVDAHGLVEQYASVEDLCRLAARVGTRVGLRRLAQQFSALTRLHGLPLSYVKLGGGFVTGLAQSPGSQALAASVLDLARECNIEVLAEDVPDAATRDILRQLGVTLMRGPGVAEN